MTLLLPMQVVLVGKMSDYQLHSSHHSFCLHDGTGAIDVSRFDNDATEAPDAWEAVPVSFDEGRMCMRHLTMWKLAPLLAAVPPMTAKCTTYHLPVLRLQGKPEQKRKVRKLEDGQYVKAIGTVSHLNGELRFKAYHTHFPSQNEVAAGVPWRQARRAGQPPRGLPELGLSMPVSSARVGWAQGPSFEAASSC